MDHLHLQAEGGSSDCLLLPVQEYTNPLYGDKLVMCQVQTGEHETHPTNTRAAAAEVASKMNGGLVLNKNIFLQTQMELF